jgi:hypothetical protein
MSRQNATQNNEAVRLLASGEHFSAVMIFWSALNSIRTSIMITSKVSLEPMTLQMGSLSKVAISSNSSSEGDTASPHNEFRFYARALWLNSNENPSTFDERSLSLVLLFNLAITYHHKGLLVGNMSDKLLRKALEIYKIIVLLVGARNDLGEPKHEEWRRFLTIAVASNMGHIFSHFFLMENVIVCRDLLDALLAARHNTSSMLDEDDSVIFLTNTASYFQHSGGTTPSAPAA